MPGLRFMAVFAHPDDETSAVGGTLCRVIDEGGEALVVTATRGEQGTLGTGGRRMSREDLPAVREAELREVLRSYGLTAPPVLLGYRDQEARDADPAEVTARVLDAMRAFKPDVVATFGPLGISRHDDHIAIHHTAREAFYAYAAEAQRETPPRLWYAAIDMSVGGDIDGLELDGPEASPNVYVDVADYWRKKSGALRLYRSQEDAQEFAAYLEANFFACETFHQEHPALAEGSVTLGL
ncbi:MAG: PIG-L family deacetylase [Chloroflexota bacterium]|nr:PIG-L family deacetylase [Chloroflexota bacterium]